MFCHIPTLQITLGHQPDCLYHNNFLILQSDPYAPPTPRWFLIITSSEQTSTDSFYRNFFISTLLINITHRTLLFYQSISLSSIRTRKLEFIPTNRFYSLKNKACFLQYSFTLVLKSFDASG